MRLGTKWVLVPKTYSPTASAEWSNSSVGTKAAGGQGILFPPQWDDRHDCVKEEEQLAAEVGREGLVRNRVEPEGSPRRASGSPNLGLGRRHVEPNPLQRALSATPIASA